MTNSCGHILQRKDYCCKQKLWTLVRQSILRRSQACPKFSLWLYRWTSLKFLRSALVRGGIKNLQAFLIFIAGDPIMWTRNLLLVFTAITSSAHSPMKFFTATIKMSVHTALDGMVLTVHCSRFSMQVLNIHTTGTSKLPADQ